MNLSIEVIPFAGKDIFATIQDAKRLSALLGTVIEFRHNGIMVYVTRTTDEITAVTSLMMELSRKNNG